MAAVQVLGAVEEAAYSSQSAQSSAPAFHSTNNRIERLLFLPKVEIQLIYFAQKIVYLWQLKFLLLLVSIN